MCCFYLDLVILGHVCCELREVGYVNSVTVPIC